MENNLCNDPLFTYDDSWFYEQTYNFYYNCVLKKDIQNFKKGDVIPMIWIDYETFTIVFYDKDDEKIYECKFETKII